MSKEQGTGKGHKTLENILAMFDDKEDNENFQVDRSKLYSAVLVALNNSDKVKDPLIQRKLLSLTTEDLEKEKCNAPCAVSAISVLNTILKEIQENKCDILEESLVQSALAVAKLLKNFDGRRTPDLMKLTVDTFIMYPNGTIVQLTSNYCKDVLGMFGKPEISFTLIAPVLAHLLKILPDHIKTVFIKEGLNLWFYPFINNYPNTDLLAKNIDILELLTDHIVNVDYSENCSWQNLLGYIWDVKKYPTLLKELLLTNSSCWYRLWIIFIKLLKDQITVNRVGITTINSLLPVIEQAFKMDTICRNRAFMCWNALIDNFAKDLNGSLNKKVNLLMTPLNLNNAKVAETVLMKMKTWWHFIYKFHSRMDNLIDAVLMPFLYYCFGKSEGVKGRLVPVQMTEGIALNSVEALIEIVGHDNCEGCIKLPRLESKLINTKVLVEHWRDWIFFLNVAIKTLARFEKDNAKQQLTCLWKGFVTTIGDLPENQIRADLFSELLKMVQTLLDNNDTKMTKLIFDVLILSLFDDSTKQLLKTKSMGHVNWGPLPCILAILQSPVMTTFTSTMVTEDLISKLKPLTDIVVNPSYAIPETLMEWFIKNPPANPEKIPIWAALAESICEARYKLKVKNAINMLLWPIKHKQHFSQERCEALWHRWYKLHKTVPYLGAHYYTELEETLRAALSDTPTPSNVHFMTCAVLVLLEKKLDDDNRPSIVKEMQILLEVLENVGEAKLEKLIPILVTVLIRPKNPLSNKELDNENIIKIISLTLHYLNQLIKKSAITDGPYLIENLLLLIDNIAKPNQYRQLHDNLVDRLIQTLTLVNDGTKQTINKILTKISLMKENTKATPKSEIAVNIMDNNPTMKEKQSDSNFQTPEQKSVKKVKKRGVANVVSKTNENGEEFEVIKSNWKFNPKKLTEAQKEKLKRKREDIPALYQDLSQSQEEFSLKAWKTDSQETSTSSKSNSKSTDNVTLIIKKLPSAEVVPKIIETMLSDTANKTKNQPPDKATSKLESPARKQKQTTTKDPKTPRIALKDRVFRNVRNLIEKSGLQSPDKSSTTSKDIVAADETPITKTKSIATDSAPSAESDKSPNPTEVITHTIHENFITSVTTRKRLNASRSASSERSNIPSKLTDSIDQNVNENVLKTPVTKTNTSNAARPASIEKSDKPPNLTDSINHNVNEIVPKIAVTKTKTPNSARSTSVENSDETPKLTDSINHNVNENVLKTPVTRTKRSNSARSTSVEKSDTTPKLTDNIIHNVNENVLKTPVTKSKTSNSARSTSVDKSEITLKITDNINDNVNENVLKTPVTETKTKSSASNSASSERPVRSIRRPKKFEDTEIYDLKKRRRSIGDSQQDDNYDKQHKDSQEQQVSPEEPTLFMKESKILKEQNKKATELTVPQPSIILEQPQGPLIKDSIVSGDNEVSSSQIESFYSCETQEKSKEKSDTIKNKSDAIVEIPEENIVDDMVSEIQASEADGCSQVKEEISTPKLKTKKTKDDEQSVIKKKLSMIEKQLLIDTNEGHPILQTQSAKRPTRKNTESMSKKRKSFIEKSTKLKAELELTETDIKKQKSCDNSQVITVVESHDKNSQSTEDFPMSEDVIESSQDSTLTTISVKSTSKKKVPYVKVDKLSPENQKCPASSQSVTLIDDELKVTPLAKTKHSSKTKFTDTQQLLEEFNGDIIPLSDIELPKNKTIEVKESSAENKKDSPNKIPLIRLDLNNPLANCSVHPKRLVDVTHKLTFSGTPNTQENRDDIDFTKNKSADGSNEINLTETMDTEPMEDSDVMIINDEDAPIVINTEEISVGKETQELAEADTLPMEAGSQSINETFDKGRDNTKKSQNDNDITNMTIQNDAPEVSTTVEMADIIGESSNSGSPFKDTIQRKKDFLNDTIEISPIKTVSPIRENKSPSPDKSDEYVVIKLLAPVQSNGEPYNEKCDSPEIFTDDKVSPDKRDQSPPRKEVILTNSSPSSSLSLKKNRPQMRANGRAAQMLGLCVPEKLQILNTDRSENEEVRRGSPMNTRAKRNLRILYNSAEENVENENAVNTKSNENGSEEGEPFLKLKRSLPTADCSPSGPILKRKLAEIADEATVSPASKNMVTQLQMNVLLDFLENHRDLAKGRLRNTLGRNYAKELWDQISTTLNSIEGCRKTSVQWQTVWRDRKYMAKKAAVDLKKPPIRGCVRPTRLHRWERRVLDIVGYKYTDNQPPKRDLVPVQSEQELQPPNKANKRVTKEKPGPSGLPMDLSKSKETQNLQEGPVGSQHQNSSEKLLMPEQNTWGSGQEVSQFLPPQGPVYPKKSVPPNPVQESPILPPPPPPQSRPVNLSMKNRNSRGLSQGRLPLANATPFMENVQEAPMGLQTSRSDVTQPWMKALTQEPPQYASSLPGQIYLPPNISSGNPIKGGPVGMQQQQPFKSRKKGITLGASRKHLQVPSEVQGPFNSHSVPLMEPSHNGSVPVQSMRFVRPNQSMPKRNHSGYSQEQYQSLSNVPSDGPHMNQVPFVNPSQNRPVSREQRSLLLNQLKDRSNSRDEECLGALRHRLLRIEEERLSESRILKEELSGIRIMLQTLVDMLSDKMDFI